MLTISGRELRLAWASRPVLPGRVTLSGKQSAGWSHSSFGNIVSNDINQPYVERGRLHYRPIIVSHAFLGVGAPEAVLVGVVALVLFGPKGLAQAAKSLGQGVKAIAPTLKELTDISSDLKSTIEDEIGLNEIRDELQSTLSPMTAKPRPARNVAMPSDGEDPDIDSKRKESEKLAWTIGEANPSIDLEENRNINTMSVEELEAEILRRKSSESLES